MGWEVSETFYTLLPSLLLLTAMGRVAPELTERSTSKPSTTSDRETATKTVPAASDDKALGTHASLAPSGEWVAAGFSGEGMVHAWLSWTALAWMVLDREDALEGWFPDILRVTEKRWRKASVDTLVSRFM